MTPQEIFSKNQILDVKTAKELIGKRIAFTHPTYRANKPVVKEMAVGGISTAWDCAANDSMPGYQSRQHYWGSYMSQRQIQDEKNTLVLLDEAGRDTAIRAHLPERPVFTCSDADRPVYYVSMP